MLAIFLYDVYTGGMEWTGKDMIFIFNLQRERIYGGTKARPVARLACDDECTGTERNGREVMGSCYMERNLVFGVAESWLMSVTLSVSL